MSKNPFDYINFAIYGKGKDPSTNNKVDDSYNMWLMNKALSFHPDLVFIAQALNRKWPDGLMDQDRHWQMVRFIVNNRVKRPWKWVKSKKEKQDKDAIKTIMTYYNCSHNEAEAILPTLSEKELERIDREVNPPPNIDNYI